MPSFLSEMSPSRTLRVVAYRTALFAGFAALLGACGNESPAPESTAAPQDNADSAAEQLVDAVEANVSPEQHLTEVLVAQPPEVKERYKWRHPSETLAFFGVEPGMTVVETDPGAGWYTRILMQYLGEGGTLIGADYAIAMYPLFNYYSDEELAAKASWAERWPAEMGAGGSAGAALAGANIGAISEARNGTVDVYLFVRVLHNLADFEEEGAYLSAALAEAFRVLKPGGVVGVVQHWSPDANSDEWASGANGYLKKDFVIARFEDAGFTLDGESSVNENPMDQPSEDEYVWRLPPASEDPEDPELAAKYLAIGESNRMTLKFRKPAAT
ncbi:MAG: methyltransferase domain-containing protein [Pseudomonadota bacterium]